MYYMCKNYKLKIRITKIFSSLKKYTYYILFAFDDGVVDEILLSAVLTLTSVVVVPGLIVVVDVVIIGVTRCVVVVHEGVPPPPPGCSKEPIRPILIDI